MKKPTILKIALLFLLFLQCDVVSSQNLKPFVRQFDKQLKGDILVIGNNILNRRETNNRGQVITSPNTAYNGTGFNGDFDMRYINIDNGATTGIFSSSSATLTVPNNRAPADPCYRVAYAALYWSATLKSPASRANINKVKIKVPNTTNSAYQDVTGTVIHDIVNAADGINPDNTQAYACFAEITNLLSAANPNGTYTVANVISSEGSNGGTGLSAGWSLFIVYEDSSLPSKAISSFNGFTARAQGGGPNNTVINGFTTIPTGPVQARFAFAALEGDYGYRGDYLQINGSTITPPTRPRQSNSDNFFNSSINSLGASFTNRVPNSTNTLGFDTGVIDIDPSANIIKNNDTSATITLGTNSDIFIYYFTAFSVDIIAPKVVLKKAVKDINNNDASNKNVVLGEELRYELSFQNEGNDNATSFTIIDQLPVNTTFNFPSDIISLPPGMTIPTTAAGNQYVTYNATTRTITFTIPNSYVTAVPTRAPESTIKFRVKVVDDCSKLTDACSNIIKNSAESHYFGQLGSTTTDFGDKSYSTTAGCNLVPQSTNFLVGLDACKNRRQEICTTNMVISASGGYKSYSWSTNASGTPVIGTNQSLTITQPGTYYVYNTANPPCIDLQETITVVDGGGVRTNPVIPYADNKEPDGTIVGCVIDGKPLPKIYLCGTNDSRLINVNVTNGTVVWQKTNCVRPVDLSETCADERGACTWVSAGPDGPTFNANTAGYYRVTINAGGCNNTYYFNVYKSDVSVTVSKKDKLCYKSGNITVQQINGYEYSLTNLSNNTTGAYQDSNSFEIWNAGTYVVNYRLKGIVNTCVYKTQQIIINDLNINAKVENPNEQPLCFGSNGSITVSASAGFSSYYFVLYDGATIIDQVGPLTDRVHTFSVAPGKYYEVEVYSVDSDGKKDCTARAGKYINNPSSEITPVTTTIVPLTACSDGKYRISATGGSGTYSYFVDGSTTAQAYSENDNTQQNNIIIVAPAAKTYSIRVVDSNLCEKTITLTVPGLPKPTYTVSNTNSACYNSGAEIRVTLGAGGANGYTMAYSINNGGTYQANPVFSNLQPGTYKVIVKYSITYPVPYFPNTETKECIDPAQTVIISGPTAALVASAGVAELAGCTLSQLGGKLRINNAQGGTAPYQYSFDNGGTWQASNEKDVLPGQYILKIRDALGCEYTIPYNIILDQKPVDPTIKVDDPVFNCNGTATSKVTVTNGTSANYTYEYYLDGVANTPITNNTFLNVPSGSHTVSVKYNVTTVSTYSNLLQEDFGKGGYTTTPGINPAYCFEDESTPHPVGFPCGNFNDYQINDGKYAVASSIKTNFGNSWIFAKDHTLPADPLGRFLCVNVGGSAGIGGILYSKPIKDVIVNQPVIISLWAENLIVKTSTTHDDPKLTIQLVNNLNGVGGPQTIVATTDTTNPWVVPKTEKWEYKELSLNPGTYNNLSFVIRSYSNEFNGNDVLIDDIWVRQIPKSCIAQKDFPIVIDSNKAFTASVTGFKDVKCLGSNDGEITIAAQNFNLPYGFDYSLDNGATWINSKVSPVTATGLSSKTYNIQVRYDASASSCTVPLTQIVKSPTAVTVTATVTKLPTCTTGATITAVGAGGTPAYQYELRQSNGTTVVTAFQGSGVFTNVPAGTYTVVTRDSNACSSPASAVVTVNSSTAPTASLAATSDLCYDTVNQSTLVVTATGTGSLTYSLDGQPAQTSNTFTNVGPGTHNIVVTDSNSCTAAISNIVIAPELKGTAVISKTLDCTLATPDATITVNIAGGNSPFTYKVKKGAGAYGASIPVTGTSFVYSANAADTYTFEITDAKGCTNIVSAIVNPIVNPTVTATKVDATCNGASTGSVQLVGAGGSGGYTYLFYNNTTLPVPTTFLAQASYTGLAAGTYSYQVMDSKGCKSAVGTITIAQPTTLTATATATTFTCNASNVKQAATVTIAVPTTGTAPYEYSFDGGTTFTSTRTLSVTDNGTNQTISYVVKDAQGCKTGVQTITINRLNPPTDITFSAAAVTCTATTTTVTATATNGVGTITYSITSPAASVASNTTGVFAGLAPGTYNFRATDANGCYFNKPFIINAVTPISVVANKDSDVLCKGGSTGKVTFTVSGIATVGAYTHTLTAGTGTVTKAGNTLTLANVVAGTYTLQVTDTATGCTNTATITINEPANPLTLTAVPTNISCNNGIAQITVTPSGGTPNYTYAVVIAGATAPTVFASGNVLSVDTNSGANLNWDVYVKDANGCITPRAVTIAKDNLPSVTATNGNQCTGTASTFVITATGTGKAPLTYSIDGTSFQTSNVFNVPAGTYTVTVKDGNGCTATTVTPLIIYPQLVALASVTKELDCTTTPNATITVAVSGGKSQFTYTVKKGSGATSAPSAPFSGTSFTYAVTAINADSYTFVVTDANGCSSTTTTTVNTISSPTVTETHINPSCDGGANGSVVLVGAGGSGGYTYSNNGTVYTANATFTGLAAGTYTFYVKDSKDCATPITVTLTAPTQLAATVTEVPFSCNTSNGKVAGSVTVNVTLGTGTTPYQYSFNGGGFGNSNTLTLNDNGANQGYTYSVRDGLGCTISGSGTLLRLNPPTDITFSAAAVTCTATTTTVTATSTNGVGTITYSITSPAASVASNTTGVFAGLAPGTYNFRATDANGCYFNKPFIINAVTPISVVANKDSDVLCKGGSTGKVTFTVSGIATVGAYTHTLTAGIGTVTKAGNTLTLANVVAGTYTLQVTDTATGCTNTATITINEPANPLTLTAVPTNISCNNGIAQITVTPSGGTPNYTYAVVIAGATAPTVFASGNVLSVDTNSGANLNWDVYVKDANGCITPRAVTIAKDNLPSVTATNGNQCTGTASTFVITATGTGKAPLTYSIDGTSFQTSNVFNVPAGTYTVTVKDGNGCTATTVTPLIIYPQLVALASVTKELDCTTTPNATITVAVSGGKSQFTYTVKKGSGATSAPSAPFSGTSFTYAVTAINADSYTFVVTDANGCSSTTTTTVNTISSPTVTETHINPSCDGGANGSVVLVGAGGSGGYTYSNNGTVYTANATFTGLAAGTYTFYVKDSKDCATPITVTLTAPTQLAATVTEVPFSCNTSNGKVAGSVTVNVTLGTGTTPYQYSFNGGGFGNSNTLTLNDNGADQGYTYSVRDGLGCTISGSGTLLRLNPPTDLTFTAAAVTCTATTTTVTVTATNGVGVLQYETIAPSPVIIAKQTSNSFANLAPGTYMFKVTDANGCFYTEAHTINPVTPITLIGTKISDVLCNAGNTGAARFNVAGFAATYSYTVNGGTAVTAQTASTINLTTLVAGTYTVIVTDNATGCTATAAVTINQPAALAATYTTINGNCAVTTSNVTVTVTGGSPVYRYSFVQDNAAIGTYSNSNTANLDAAVNTSWDVHIIDANGCTFKLDITIAKDVVPTVTASATGQCFGVGSYTITATPGTGLVAPLSYSIDNGASYQAGNTFVITTPGSYTVKIKDGNGCTADSNVVIVDNVLTLNAVLDKNITCSLPTAAQVTLTANGGSVAYTYESKEAAGAYTAMASNVFNTMTPGSYTFRVTDAKGCIIETTTPIIITAPVNPDITNVVQTALINCNGDATAAIAITIDNTKGLAPFVYTVLNTTTGVNYGTQTSGLAAGNYVVTVTDAKGCTDTFPITINQPTPIVVSRTVTPITCAGGGVSLGSITINSVTGGTPNYIYHVTGVNGYNKQISGQTGATAVFEVVDFGLYQIIITDANGCTNIEQNVLVASPPDDLDITVTPPPADCSTLGSAVVAINTTSLGTITGPGPFHFAIYTGPGMVYTAPTALPWYDEDAIGSKKTTIPNLLPGVKYTFIVHDTVTGCYYFETSTTPIPTQSTLTISNLVEQNITCKGANDGKVSFTINSTYPTATDVTYEILNSLSLTPITPTAVTGSGTISANGTLAVTNLGPLPYGTYVIVIKEVGTSTHAGCSIASSNFIITESAIDLSLTASVSKNANCNPASGVITAIGKDGTAPYTYQLLLASATAPTAATAGWASVNTFNRDAGSYIAYVKDAYGCIKQAAVTLNKDADPTIIAPATICYNGTAFTIAIGGTVDPAIVGAATYSVNGSTFQTSPNFTFNAAGIYNLTIKDGNGCIATVPYEVKPQLFLSAQLTKELDCTGTPNAQITLTATGGYNTAYTYEYSTDGGGTYTAMATNVLSTSVLGNYIFRVSDAKLPTACQATTTFKLDPIQPTIFTTVQTHVSCNGGNDGTITVNVTSGVGPYQYQLNGGTFQTSNVFTGLIAGTAYIVTVRDAKSCLYSNPAITITQPNALTAAAVLTTPLTCGTGNAPTKAVVTVTASQGTAPYLYNFDGAGYSTTNTYESYVGVTFNVLVKDAKGCIFPINGVNIPALNPPTITTITGTPIYCDPIASTTSTVTITTTNGVGALSYVILSPATTNVTGATSGVFTGLPAGTYLFEVTDANGCKDQESYIVKPVTNITVSGELVSNVTCNGGNNGAVKFTAANYAGTYTAVLTAGTGTLTQTGNTVNVTGLVPGTYTVEITDGITGCKATASIAVTQPTPVVLSLVSNTNANCNFGARVTVSATGGTPAYKYAFVQSGATPVAGDYDTVSSVVLDPALNTAWDAYVLDANDCPAVYSFTIATDLPPTIDTPAAPYCYMGGPVPITITGTYVGTPMYSIGNNYQSSPDFVLNAPGTYTFSIRDGNGCVTSTAYELKQQLLLKATLTQDYTCAGDASITLLATQGTLTYNTFEVSYNNGAYTAVTVQPYTTNIPGTYTFRVTDSQGCQATSVSVEVTPRTTPTATATQNNVSCTGGSDGSIVVTAANGVLPYQYQLDGGAFQTSNIFTGLAAGTHNIVVKDAKECVTITLPVTITQPTALAAIATVTTPLTCGTGNAAQAATVTVTVDPTTGTGPYQYSFNGGTSYGSVNTYTTTVSGPVSALVKDANNCVIAVPASVTVQPLDPPTIDNVTATPIWCTPAANTTSTVTLTVSHGVGTLHYEITSPASAVSNFSGATSGQFNLLPAGTYIFKVTDANGCTAEATKTVDALINITTAGQLINDVVCNGEANGSVKFDVDNFAGTYTAVLTPATGTLTKVGKVITVTNLPVGNYAILVTDDITGCTATASVTVGQPNALSLTATKNTHANCKSGAEVTVVAAGGTPDYKYAFILNTATVTAADYSNSNNAVLDPAKGLNWVAYVIDSKDCKTSIPITIVLDPLPNNITTNVSTQQCPSATGEYTFTVTVGNGIAPYEYSIGNGFQSSNIFTVNAPGNYTVTVRDANQCEVTVATPVTILPALKLDHTITALPGCVVTNNGIITATASGGSATANYRYTLDGGVIVSTTPAVFSNVTPGTHIIRVRDVVTGCSVQITVVVAPSTPIAGLALTPIHVTCNGGSNGSITATIDETGVNDNPVYVYRLTGTTALGVPVSRPNQPNPTFENLQAGDYTVTVTSGRGCQDSEDIRINQFDPIVVTAPVVVQYGCTVANTSNFATVTVGNVTNGSGTYTNYEFFRDGVSVQSGPQTVYTETDYLGGNYTVKVTDDAGCSGTSIAAPIRPFISLDVINVAKVAITCISNEDITITVTSTGGTPALLNYTVTGTDNAYNQTKTNGNFTGLTVGNYIITVTNPATGCSLQKAYYVAEPNTFEIKAIPVVKEICFGTTDGIVDLTFVDNQLDPTNDAGPFNYTITGPAPSTATITGTTTDAGPLRISNLAAGQYSVIARLVASPECTVSTVFSIDQPATILTVTAEKDDITCKTGNNDGVIYASAQGGWDTSYEYQLVLNPSTIVADYSATAVFTNLGAGTYTVNVRDSKGCPVSTQVTLAIPTPITFTAAADATMLSCFGDKSGVIRVSPPTGGQGSNYLYTLTVLSNNPVTTVGPQISPVFDGLGMGRYTVTVTDGFSCTATSSAEIVITEPTLVKATLAVTRQQTCLTLSQLTLTATGGTGPYSYSATADFAIVLGTFAATTSFDVPVGSYSYYVRDVNGCNAFVTDIRTIDPLVPLNLNIDVSGAVVRCQGDASASIFAEAIGGLGDYVYTLLGATNNVVRAAQTNGTFENLPIGTYYVKVDSHDCTYTSGPIVIDEPATPVTVVSKVTDVTCFGANNGIIEITATGGTGNIQYAISPDLDKFDSKFIFDKLAPGDYQIVVKDENLCGGIYNFTIANGNLLYATLDATSIQPELCAGENNASFRVDIFGGKPGYFVRIDNETAFVPANGGTFHTFSGLKGGKHIVYFTDSYGCGPFELVVETPESVTIDPTTTETVYGCETNTTTVLFDKSNNVDDLDFSLDNTGVINPDGPVFKDLTPGPHTILVRHTNGCEKRTEEFIIEGFDKLTLTDITVSSKAEVNIIRVQAAGGKKPYLYSFDGGPFTESNEFRIYESRIYKVTVRDQNGCEATIDVEGKFIDFCLPNYFTPNGSNGGHTEIGPGCGALAYKNLTFDIFDRYGRVVAKYHVGQKWDGKYNGEELPTGDYWYVLKLNDEKDDREFVGHFTLYR